MGNAYPSPVRWAKRFTAIHRAIPQTVGIIKASAVHFQLPVSFLMVRQVVEQGQ